jgi:hypothetical protein
VTLLQGGRDPLISRPSLRTPQLSTPNSQQEYVASIMERERDSHLSEREEFASPLSSSEMVVAHKKTSASVHAPKVYLAVYVGSLIRFPRAVSRSKVDGFVPRTLRIVGQPE